MPTNSPQRRFKILVNNTFSYRVWRFYIELHVDTFLCEVPIEEGNCIKTKKILVGELGLMNCE